MTRVPKAAERLGTGILIAITVTVVCGALAVFPDAPWWSPILGSWIAVLFHIAVLAFAVWQEARQ